MRLTPLTLVAGILSALLGSLPSSAEAYQAEDWAYSANTGSTNPYQIENGLTSQPQQQAAPIIQQSAYHTARRAPGNYVSVNNEPLPPVVQPEEWDETYNDASESTYGIPQYRQGSWVAGVDFLFLRRNHSDNKAFVRQQHPTAPTNGVTTNRDDAIYFDSDYKTSFRPYIAYRLCDCCSEIRFSYWNLSSDSSATATAQAGTAQVGNTTYSHFEIVQLTPGESMTSTTSMDTNIFDIEFSRCIRMGDESCCGCPRWDLQWTAGLRIADVKSGNSSFLSDSTNRVDTSATFTGAGPRVGLQGKRYFGSCGQFSINALMDVALLVGNFDHEVVRVSAVGAAVERFDASITRVTPVIDMEIGGSWKPHRNWTVSAGWLLQAWWDVTAMEDEMVGSLNFIRDDANITSWDGFTLRVEAVY